MHGPEDERLRELLALARGGDRGAFDELTIALRPRIKTMGWVSSYLQPRLDGSDIAQEVLMNVWSGLPEFRGSGIPQFLAWVRQTAIHALRDQHSHAYAKKRDARREGGEMPPELADSTLGPADIANAGEFWRCIADCLPKLTEAQREAVELIVFKCMGYAEAGEVLGKNRGTVMTNFRAALPVLRRCLGEETL